jgi:hypothetical protein
MAKKSSLRPITALKRSVVFDGRGLLRCEKCSVEERIVSPVYPEMPTEQFSWVVRFNSRVLEFLKKHRECA